MEILEMMIRLIGGMVEEDRGHSWKKFEFPRKIKNFGKSTFLLQKGTRRGENLRGTTLCTSLKDFGDGG